MPPSAIGQGLPEYGDTSFSLFLRRVFLLSSGVARDDLSRPVVGIAHTISDFVTCHRDMPQLVAAIERGVHQAGGLPLSFPLLGLGEPFLHPTSMYFRNLAAIAAEELIRGQPMDAVVVVGGCDKTLPAQLMGAMSADRPLLASVCGSMLSGHWRGRRIGACTDCRQLWAEHRAGILPHSGLAEVERELCPTAGTCMVMGTASTMACLGEALGVMLLGGATPPAPSAARLRHGVATGRAAVKIATSGAGPRQYLSRASFQNALVVLAAIGGSTNAVIHLLAIARRAGIALTLDDVRRGLAGVPLLVNLKPSGTHFMEDFDRAGGMAVLMQRLRPLLDLSAKTATGATLGEALGSPTADTSDTSVIATLDEPLRAAGSLAVLRGTLAPNGALIKTSAASPELLRHTGPALVLDSPEEAARRLDDPQLDVSPDTVLVLRNAGPVAAGMPEAGALPIPSRLAAAGVTDMVRVSDARMSGTAYGTVVLHCAPEAAVGGPLAIVRDGDRITLDAEAGRLDLDVDPIEVDQRLERWRRPSPPTRGWARLYADTVTGAELGADLAFLWHD
jgi:dihydroxy-acid dehydratase